MIRRRSILKSATAALALTLAGPLAADDGAPLKVVATFSILGDMVAQVGGEHVEVTSLVGPNGDAHVYSPSPADARSVAAADVLIVNGLEFEGWLDRLVEASEFSGTRVVATSGIEPIAFEEGEGHDDHDDHEGDDHADHDDHHDHEGEEHAGHKDHDDHHDEDHAGHDDHDEHDDHKDEDHAGHDDHDDHHGHDHGAFDPHAWQSLPNAVAYADAIAVALAKADPANAAAYEANRAAYVSQIETLDAEVRAMFDALPADKRTVVTAHDAFQYFAKEYGLTFVAPIGLSTEAEASAQDVAKLIEQMRAEGISAVFVENITDTRLIDQIARETGATVGGTLYPGALSDADGPAATYLDLFRHNATTLAQALGLSLPN